MHLLIPFASGLSDAARQAADALTLPNLGALLGRLACTPEPTPVPGPDSFSPPHERALARALGWSGGDGRLPLGAWRAQADGLDTGNLPWAELTPVHWQAGRDQVLLLDPAALDLAGDPDTARAVFDAIRPLFTDEGLQLAWGRPDRWYLGHESLAELRTASIDRVIGRSIDPFLPYDPAARRFRRLQQEVQMLLYQHPQHEARLAAGRLPVNSFWLSGCGATQPVHGTPPRIADALRAPALAADWTSWRDAWQDLDATLLSEALAAVQRREPVRIDLCGERTVATLAPVDTGLWSRLLRRMQPPAPGDLLRGL